MWKTRKVCWFSRASNVLFILLFAKSKRFSWKCWWPCFLATSLLLIRYFTQRARRGLAHLLIGELAPLLSAPLPAQCMFIPHKTSSLACFPVGFCLSKKYFSPFGCILKNTLFAQISKEEYIFLFINCSHFAKKRHSCEKGNSLSEYFYFQVKINFG